jgi:hypothetical protein
MPIIITAESDYGKELAKWEQPNYNPQDHPFPMMLCKAQRRPDGVPTTSETDDNLFGAFDERGNRLPGQPGAAELFCASCQLTVGDEQELTRALEMGWRHGPTEAMEFFEEKEKGLAAFAAHRAHDDRNMGDKAKAEAAAVEASTVEHVAEVPRKKVRRRRKRA